MASMLSGKHLLSEGGQAMKAYIYERLRTPKIKTSRAWDSDDVRRMCIKHDFYTCGDNEEYSAMLRYVDEHEPTTENLYIIAVDIYEHSALDDFGQYGDSVISSIMFDLEREAVRTFHEIKEG